MAKGLKTGGRQKGSRNHRTEAQAVAIEKSGLTPLDYMLTVLRDPNAESELRMEAARSAAPYVHPKLANIEVTGKDGGPLQVNIVQFSNHPERLGPKTLPNALVGRS
jgi:hypothetical protein